MPVAEKDIEKEMEQQKILTFADILRALRAHPDWLEELRRLILTEELIELPKRFESFLKEFKELKSEFHEFKNKDFKELKDKVEVIEKDVAGLKHDVAGLKHDVAGLKHDVGELKQDVRELKDRTGRLEQDVEQLKQDVAILKQDVAILKQDVAILKKDMSYVKGELGRLKGREFERTIREKYYAFFGRVLRRSKLIPFEEILPLIDDAEEQGIITESERDSILRLDLLIRGRLKSTDKEVILAVEISYSLKEDDIERASVRADRLHQLLKAEVIPTIVSAEYEQSLEKLAEDRGILIVKADFEY